jgi:hypothetical protein
MRPKFKPQCCQKKKKKRKWKRYKYFSKISGREEKKGRKRGL